jgi:thiol-disulfide isomerase/thioredoxin
MEQKLRTAGKIASVQILILLATMVSVFGNTAYAGTKAASAASTATKEWVDFTLPKPGGGQVSLGQFIGKKPVLLFFWATWCPHCNESVPVINRMHQEASTSGKLQILALDFMESEKKVLLDRRGRVARKYKVLGIPTYILLDRDGKVVFRDHELPEIGKYLK